MQNFSDTPLILPDKFTQRMKSLLGSEWEAFLHAMQGTPPVSIRFNPGKGASGGNIFPELSRGGVAWCEDAVYLKERPLFTLDPCFHAGAYYVQEASSMFLGHILKQLTGGEALRVLDLCAAPGGKSTLTASLLPAGSLLVANETVRTRASILKENIIKWGHDNVVVTNNDPSAFSGLTGMFDLLLVDAPCSGEGMFRKDKKAIVEWSEQAVKQCSDRQRKILSAAWPALKPGGYLIYSTCTYNREENEDIASWLAGHYAAASVEIKHTFHGITSPPGDIFSYRFYPHKTEGEGFFITVLQKTEGETYWEGKNGRKHRTSSLSLPPEVKKIISPEEDYTVYKEEERYGIFPARHAAWMDTVERQLHVLYKGCELAEINNRKLKLLHPAALYKGIDPGMIPPYGTDLLTALTYLRKEELPRPTTQDGWMLVTYGRFAIGWVKNIGNRLNNHYPTEWRIRMASPTDL